ncbi:MAG: hypothetical protein QM726_21435 [Chitinophagaceae bacterium]
MEETNFVLLWKEQYQKIDQALVINKRLLEERLSEKANNVLRSLAWLKSLGVIAGIFYLLLLGSALFIAITHYSHAADYFIVSLGAIFLINIKAVYDYVRHIIWIKQINFDGRITDIQEQLSRLQLSMIQHVRVMCLQFPFWTTFSLSSKWFPSQTPTGVIILVALLTCSFVALSIFLYRNLTIDNMHKKWVRSVLSGISNKKVEKAMELCKEIASFKE